MGIRRYSIDVLLPNLPKWKKKLYNTIIMNLPILHVKKTNELIDNYGHLKGGDFVDRTMVDLDITSEYYGLENIPESGAVTVVSNHPGGSDVLNTISAIWRKRKDFKVLANKLVCVDAIESLVIPVDTMKKRNKVDLEKIHKAYQDEELVVFYAAGKNSRYNDQGQLRDLPWRGTFLNFAINYKTPIVVMHIETKNSPLFYKVSDFRAKFKALKNIPLENIFQLREFFKQDEVIRIYFSEPIPYEVYSQNYDLDNTKQKNKLVEKLYDFSYSLDENHLSFKL